MKKKNSGSGKSGPKSAENDKRFAWHGNSAPRMPRLAMLRKSLRRSFFRETWCTRADIVHFAGFGGWIVIGENYGDVGFSGRTSFLVVSLLAVVIKLPPTMPACMTLVRWPTPWKR